MQLRHRFFMNVTPQQQKVLATLGMSIGIGFQTFCVDEDSDLQRQLQPYLDEWEPSDTVEAIFTDDELSSAEYLQMITGGKDLGYPQPEEHQGYLQVSYDLSNYCRVCGLGAKQTAPFRFKKEPKWGREHFASTAWLPESTFVKRDVWERVFRPFDVPCMPVLNHATGEEMATMVQIVTQGVSDGCFDPALISVKFCSVCERERYSFASWVGFRPPLTKDCSLDLFSSREEFDGGLHSWRIMLASSNLRNAIMEAGLRGVEFIPLSSRDRGR